tara:strand:+ start:1179 stop:1502 length:324 start_codon:yes stop_codon:yes gene_type:complete
LEVAVERLGTQVGVVTVIQVVIVVPGDIPSASTRTPAQWTRRRPFQPRLDTHEVEPTVAARQVFQFVAGLETHEAHGALVGMRLRRRYVSVQSYVSVSVVRFLNFFP